MNAPGSQTSKCRAPTCHWPSTQGFRTCSVHRYLDVEKSAGDRMTSWPFLITMLLLLAVVGGRVACMLDERCPELVDTAGGP